MPSKPLDLVYRPQAVSDLEDLAAFIAADRPLASARFLADIRRACEGLAWFPFIGRQLDPDNPQVRVLTVRRRAAIKYFVHEDRVHILAVSYRGRDLTTFFSDRNP